MFERRSEFTLLHVCLYKLTDVHVSFISLTCIKVQQTGKVIFIKVRVSKSQ